jgi:hypothetical protein
MELFKLATARPIRAIDLGACALSLPNDAPPPPHTHIAERTKAR